METMIYVIMCGGTYTHFEKHKALTEINGEPLIHRTVRLLKQLTNSQIFITASDPEFKKYGVILPHENTFSYDGHKPTGYWLDAFYPHFLPGTKVTYLMGDVYYTEQALHLITQYPATENTLFGTKHNKPWEEPLAYMVVNYTEFLDGINEVKKLADNGKCLRHPIIWELYRYLNGIDVNTHILKPETYVNIPHGGMDVDFPHEIENARSEYE